MNHLDTPDQTRTRVRYHGFCFSSHTGSELCKSSCLAAGKTHALRRPKARYGVPVKEMENNFRWENIQQQFQCFFLVKGRKKNEERQFCLNPSERGTVLSSVIFSNSSDFSLFNDCALSRSSQHFEKSSSNRKLKVFFTKSSEPKHDKKPFFSYSVLSNSLKKISSDCLLWLCSSQTLK